MQVKKGAMCKNVHRSFFEGDISPKSLSKSNDQTLIYSKQSNIFSFSSSMP